MVSSLLGIVTPANHPQHNGIPSSLQWSLADLSVSVVAKDTLTDMPLLVYKHGRTFEGSNRPKGLIALKITDQHKNPKFKPAN